MSRHREELGAHRPDVIERLAASRPASLEPPPRGPGAARAAALAAAARSTDDRQAGRAPRTRWVRKRAMVTAGVAFTAAGATVAVLVSAAPGPAPRAAAGTATAPRATRPPRAPARTAQPMTARQILLTAAAHVAREPVTGRYWRVRQISGLAFPGGTKAVPYDISLATSFDQWNPSSAGQREWVISQQLGARPSTPADTAAWRAAGSPASWHSGQQPGNGWLGGYPLDWSHPLAATVAASGRSATWQVSDGTVGYVEGNLAGLNAAQFRRIQPRLVEATLRHYAKLAHCSDRLCSTIDQLVWAEALALLQDPVSAPVRSATFKVMAGLPGVHLLGQRTDPLGRPGYVLAPGSQDPNPVPSHFNPTRVVLIDPRTGSLLATAEMGPMPRTLACLAGTWKKRVQTKCSGSTLYGPSYPGQLDDYVALVSAGWTNASPPLPPRPTWSGPTGSPGLPPAH